MMITTERQADWTAIRAAADRTLEENAPLLQSFRSKVASLFRIMLEDSKPPFKRKPPISLRLICDGDPPAKLIVHPQWDRYDKTTNPEFVCCELLQERFRTVGGQRVKQFGEQLAFNIGDKPQYLNHRPRVGLMYETGELDARRAIKIIREFVDDHRVVFARSHDHCCICGKGLTDELSRSRGIGPECIKKIPHFVFLATDGNQLVKPEDEARFAPPIPETQLGDPDDDPPFRLTSS
jgi:hypothetical protein